MHGKYKTQSGCGVRVGDERQRLHDWRNIPITLIVPMSLFPAKLIVVDDVFAVGDGLLLFTPTVPFALADHVHLRTGDRLELRRPDGTVLQTELFGLARTTPGDGTVGIGVKPFTKADVPVGTEIWKVS